MTHKISGFLLSRILIFSVNLHSLPRPIYLCRHGESEYNVLGLLGGNPPLTSKVFFFSFFFIFLFFFLYFFSFLFSLFFFSFFLDFFFELVFEKKMKKKFDFFSVF